MRKRRDKGQMLIGYSGLVRAQQQICGGSVTQNGTIAHHRSTEERRRRKSRQFNSSPRNQQNISFSVSRHSVNLPNETFLEAVLQWRGIASFDSWRCVLGLAVLRASFLLPPAESMEAKKRDRRSGMQAPIAKIN